MFKNRSKLKVKGLNQERALNEISKNVKVYNYRRQEQNLSEFEVDFKHAKSVKVHLENMGFEVLMVAHRGLFYSTKNLLKSYGIIAGLIIVLAFYLLQYNFVLKVEVWGAENGQIETIKDFVEENLPSHFKSKISTEDLELDIRNNFDFVSSISVAIIGQSLVINLNQAVLPDEMEGDFQPIVSSYDGLITKINLVQGTLNVNEGDIVRKGDVLVYPYTTDSDGERHAVEAKAEILANVWINETVTHYDYRIERVRTGKTIIKNQVCLGGLVIYENKTEVEFTDYDVENSSRELTKNLILPFTLNRTIYYEVETKEVTENFEDVKDEIIEKARAKALIFLEENDIIIEENYTLNEAGGCHVVNFLLTISKNIGG